MNTKKSIFLKCNGDVTLKVYDILVREVETLINEDKPVGNYEIKFNATNLSSGIYLYRITVKPDGR